MQNDNGGHFDSHLGYATKLTFKLGLEFDKSNLY